jgi:hypothetical protein
LAAILHYQSDELAKTFSFLSFHSRVVLVAKQKLELGKQDGVHNSQVALPAVSSSNVQKLIALHAKFFEGRLPICRKPFLAHPL